jgi:hypothetical protein
MRSASWAMTFLLAALLTLALCSQPSWESVMGWCKVYGGPSFDNLCSMAHTADGGYVLAGYTNSFGDGLWLVKTDADGNPQWNKTYSGAYGDESAFVIQASDGGYAIASYTCNSGNVDFWLIKTDALGNLQWNRTYGGSSYDIALSIVQTPDDGYMLAGYTDSFGGNDILLIKTDVNGVMEWNRAYTLEAISGYYMACSLILTNDGGYALATTSDFPKTDYDYWLTKIDSTGNMLWNKTYGGASSDYVYSLYQTYDNGYTLAGVTYSHGKGGDAWLVKTDAFGNQEWNMTYGGAQLDRASSVIQTSEGGYMFAGITRSFGDYEGDFWLVKTSSLGNVQWNRTYNVGEDETLSSLTLTSDGGYAFAGMTRLASSSADMCLVKTDENGIIPEFSLFTIIPLFLIITSIILYSKRKLPKPETSL